MSWQLKRLPSLMIAALAALWLAATPAWAESTFDQIKRTGELRYGAIDYPPNWYRDKTSGKWTGFLVEMVEDIAKEMGVEAVPVETTWATCVLDLQSNKTDLQFGLQATPKRATSPPATEYIETPPTQAKIQTPCSQLKESQTIALPARLCAIELLLWHG